MTDLSHVADKMRTAESVLLSCHRGPDGDAVGSMVALAALLREQGKTVTLYNPDLVPRNLKWLPHARSFVQQLKKKARFDLTIVVDCGDVKLLGDSFPSEEVTGFVVALDHHTSAYPFGDLFVSDPSAASVGAMVAALADELGWRISTAAGLGIYVSILADTGGFRYTNTDSQVLSLAARLVGEVGIRPYDVSERLALPSTKGRYRLLARVLGEMQFVADNQAAVIAVTAEMLRECKATWDDTAGLINYARNAEGVRCGVLLSPSKYGGIRVSMRARDSSLDVGAVCLGLGGGGHAAAAGCTLSGTLAEAQAQVEKALGVALAGQSASAGA